ncbi:MAG: terminase small subunit [Arenicella sp.]
MAGQPTKYNKDMQALADEYIDKIVEVIAEDGKPVKVFAFQEDGSVIPSVEGLAEYLSVARRTLYNWAEIHTEFLHTLERIEEKQKRITLNKGLIGTFNSTIAKLVLANHGMHDKVDQEHTGRGGGPIKVQESVIQPVLSLKEIEQGTNTDS